MMLLKVLCQEITVSAKYYILSAKATFQRNLSRKSSLKSLNEMNNSIFNLAPKELAEGGKMSFVCRDISVIMRHSNMY